MGENCVHVSIGVLRILEAYYHVIRDPMIDLAIGNTSQVV